MNKFVTLFLILTLTISPALATIGIGISPTSLKLDYYTDTPAQEVKITLLNTGDTDLNINVSSQGLDIENRQFFLASCSCEGFCEAERIGCTDLNPPLTFYLKIYNPRSDKIGKIVYSGVGASGGMVKTSVSAETSTKLTYYGSPSTTSTTITATTIHSTTTSTSSTTISGGGGGGSGSTLSTSSTTSPKSTTYSTSSTSSSSTTIKGITTTSIPKPTNNDQEGFLGWLLGSQEAFYIIIVLVVLFVILIIYLILKDKIRPSRPQGKYEPNDFYLNQKGQFGAIKAIFWLIIILTIAILVIHFLSVGKLFG